LHDEPLQALTRDAENSVPPFESTFTTAKVDYSRRILELSYCLLSADLEHSGNVSRSQELGWMFHYRSFTSSPRIRDATDAIPRLIHGRPWQKFAT
jgi:hypothetical protein